MRFWIIVLLGVSLYVSLSSARPPRPRPKRIGIADDVDVAEHVLEKRSVVAMSEASKREGKAFADDSDVAEHVLEKRNAVAMSEARKRKSRKGKNKKKLNL